MMLVQEVVANRPKGTLIHTTPMITKHSYHQAPICSVSWEELIATTVSYRKCCECESFFLLFTECETEQKTPFYLQSRCYSELLDKPRWGLEL